MVWTFIFASLLNRGRESELTLGHTFKINKSEILKKKKQKEFIALMNHINLSRIFNGLRKAETR